MRANPWNPQHNTATSNFWAEHHDRSKSHLRCLLCTTGTFKAGNRFRCSARINFGKVALPSFDASWTLPTSLRSADIGRLKSAKSRQPGSRKDHAKSVSRDEDPLHPWKMADCAQHNYCFHDVKRMTCSFASLPKDTLNSHRWCGSMFNVSLQLDLATTLLSPHRGGQLG